MSGSLFSVWVWYFCWFDSGSPSLTNKTHRNKHLDQQTTLDWTKKATPALKMTDTQREFVIGWGGSSGVLSQSHLSGVWKMCLTLAMAYSSFNSRWRSAKTSEKWAVPLTVLDPPPLHHPTELSHVLQQHQHSRPDQTWALKLTLKGL